jgi:hypothetical protein
LPTAPSGIFGIEYQLIMKKEKRPLLANLLFSRDAILELSPKK